MDKYQCIIYIWDLSRAAKLDSCVLCFGYCQGFFLLGVAFQDNMDIDVVQETIKAKHR